MPQSSKRRLSATSIYLAPDAMQRVDTLARLEGLSRAAWVRRLILAELRAEDRATAVAR